MAVFEVFSQPELRRYKTHIFTKATFVQIFCIALTFIPPLFVAYRSQGFWLKFDYYQEQAEVHFKHEVIVVLQLQDGGYIAWGTYQNFNTLQMEHFRTPLIRSREEDTNRDGKYDLLYFTLEMPMLDTEQVVMAQLILIFDYKLHKFTSLTMESMAYIQYSSAIPGAQLQTTGDLKFYQREPVAHKGIDTRYNTSVIDGNSIYAESYDLAAIFENYASRNMSTVLSDAYPVWVTGRGAGSPFVLKSTIRYPEETIQYQPGFWQLMKEAWIQYLAILLVFLFVFDRIKIFIYQNQLVTTIVERPWKGHQS